MSTQIGDLVRPKIKKENQEQSRLTAKQARELAVKSDPDIALDKILCGIKSIAEQGKSKLLVRDFGFGSGEMYTSEKNYPAMNRKVIEELRALGYKAEIKEKCSQFVDIWLEVSWDSVD
ncbi:hypothetical protein AAG587_08220 [Vreelandella neptunia]|uniref:hypothetical protein n=1 Tax=Vreelandella neptunia TaxID=115551 RepID=UPI00315A14A8